MNYVLIGLLALAGVACSIQPKPVAVHDFGLPVSSGSGVQSSAKPDIKVEAPEWLQDQRIRYRLLYDSPTQLRFYTLDRWVAAPPELFEQQLLAAGKWHDHRLIIRLLDFEQQFDAPGSARAVLRFAVDVYAPDNTVITQLMRLEQPTLTPDAKGAVNSLARLTGQAAGRIQVFLSGLPGTPSSR